MGGCVLNNVIIDRSGARVDDEEVRRGGVGAHRPALRGHMQFAQRGGQPLRVTHEAGTDSVGAVFPATA